MSRLKSRLQRLLEMADIRVGGDRPWDIQVHNEALYARVFAGGTLAVGESYMDGWWSCEALDELIARAHRAGLPQQLGSAGDLLRILQAKLMNMQTRRRAYEVGRRHYDLGNDLYARMLDKHMIYSCGYWRKAENLDQAQEAKLELICRKLALQPGMRVLDIGCGWGGAARYAAEHHGCEVVGITISHEQARYAERLNEGLPVEIRVQDYRELNEPFDRIYSIGMFEHVGYKNYRSYMEVVRRCLRDADSLFVLHSIGGNHSSTRTDPWIARYIFPNSMLPSAAQITAASEGVLVMEDWHNFGPDYDRTLMNWYRNFLNAWQELSSRYDERFFRMWSYYLLASAGSFRARVNQLWQVVYSRDGLSETYAPAGIR